ncbi:unnamed protein product [Microthlaspi erraticum]|uniref:Reverse transcriptase zinc-binding domain-containing protein n=1 Tax=Microthlaspi erraticum TaxID=1685480 RepID=A0A6D2ISS9_9BRAS|nr:unnamed protein product [Microthlaspi erraticum]
MKLRELARPLLFCQVNSGASALFWHDDWTTLGPLIDITGANGPRVSGINRMATVSQACRGSNWVLPRGRHPIITLLRDCLPPSLHASLNDRPDLFLWRNSINAPPGIFSSSKTWKLLHPSPPPQSWTKSVWLKHRIPKHAFILWLVMRDRLLTHDRLRSWGLSVPSNCLLCDNYSESKIHLLIDCAYSKEIWNAFFATPLFKLPTSVEGIILWCKSPSSDPKLNTICMMLTQAIIYCIWRERNGRLHSANPRPVHLLIKEIQMLIKANLFGMDRSILPISANSPTQPHSTTDSFLSTWFRHFQN